MKGWKIWRGNFRNQLKLSTMIPKVNQFSIPSLITFLVTWRTQSLENSMRDWLIQLFVRLHPSSFSPIWTCIQKRIWKHLKNNQRSLMLMVLVLSWKDSLEGHLGGRAPTPRGSKREQKTTSNNIEQEEANRSATRTTTRGQTRSRRSLSKQISGPGATWEGQRIEEKRRTFDQCLLSNMPMANGLNRSAHSAETISIWEFMVFVRCLGRLAGFGHSVVRSRGYSVLSLWDLG